MKKFLALILLLWSTAMFAQSQIEQLITDAKGDAYKLSIALLLAQDKATYETARNQMITAMTALSADPSKNSYAAWLYGRMAIAANRMHDSSFDATGKLKSLLQNPATKPDALKAWAYGYLGSLNTQEYKDIKPAMKNLALQLSNDYLVNNKDKLSSSDVSWVWVMVLQAAGHANDKDLYDEAIKQLLKITGTTSLMAALANGIPANDFFTWATAIAYSAALQVHDMTNANALKQPLEQALKVGDPNAPDIMLAQMTYQNAVKKLTPKPKL